MMHDGPAIKKEVYEKTNEFLKTHGYCLEINENSTKKIKPIFIKQNSNPTTPIALRKLFYTAASGSHRDSFITDFKKEILDNWSVELINNLYKANSAQLIKEYILEDLDISLKYLTSTFILDKINSKNLKIYSRIIKNEDSYYLFAEKLMQHPNWVTKQDEIKQFLIDNGHKKTIAKLYDNETQLIDIEKKEPLQVMSFNINYTLLPAYQSNTSNNKPHPNGKINTVLMTLINEFNQYKLPNAPICSINSDSRTTDFKEIHFVHNNEKYCDVFSKLFFSSFKHILSQEENLSNFSKLGQEAVEKLLDRIVKVYQYQTMESALKPKQELKSTTSKI